MLTVGTRIGAYTIDGVIGRGGMEEVCRASQSPLGRVVALKLLSPGLSNDTNSARASADEPLGVNRAPEHHLKGLIRSAEITPGRTVALPA